MRSHFKTTLEMACIFYYPVLCLLLRFASSSAGQEFKGMVQSYGFDVKALPGGGAISLTPPKFDIQANDPKVDFAKTEPVLIVPPVVTQAMAMVESLHPKLDVKGEYRKWAPKMGPKEKTHKLIHVETPRLVPLWHRYSKLVPVHRIKTLRRNKAVRLAHAFYRPAHSGHLFQHRTGRILHLSKIKPTKKQSLHRSKHSLHGSDDGLNREKKSEISTERKLTGSIRKYKNSRIKRDISEHFSLRKSIEALIAESLKNGKKRNATSISEHPQDQLKTKARKSMLQRRKLIRKKIKELGSPEVKRYMNSVKSTVNHVVSEAKSVLQDTGKIVHGIKRVINGAKLLTQFTKNAVKFAKYFAMEPTNATVDFFEEKAVMAVLEAEKAAAEAKIAAVEAKNTAKKVKDLLQKYEKKNKGKNTKKGDKLFRYVSGQVKRVEKLAQMTSSRETDAKKNAVVVDRALRKMIKLAKDAEEREDLNKKNGNGSEKLTDEKEENEAKEGGEIDETKKVNEGEEKHEEKEEVEVHSGNDTDDINQKENEKWKEEGTVEKLESSWNAAMRAKSIGKDKNKGLRAENSMVNKTVEASSNNTLENSNATEHTEAADMPEIFNGGGDENEVIANDFDKEGFSIPLASQQASRNDEEKEITTELDKLAENRITKSERLQQVLKGENETNKDQKSNSKKESLKGSKQANLKNEENGSQLAPDGQSANEEEEEDSTTEGEGKDAVAFPSTSIPTMKSTKVNTAKISTAGRRKDVPTSFNMPKTIAVERKVERIDKGPVNLIVTVTRRKLTNENKTSESPLGTRTKMKDTEDVPVVDPFNFKSLEREANRQSSRRQNYIVDKEDAGRAGISMLYQGMKKDVEKSSVAKKNTIHKIGPSVQYDLKPIEVVSQI